MTNFVLCKRTPDMNLHCKETKLGASHLESHVCLEYEILLHMSKAANKNETVTLLTELGVQQRPKTDLLLLCL